MKYSEFAMENLVQELLEKAMRPSTPLRYGATMLEAAEVIRQLLEENRQTRKEKTP